MTKQFAKSGVENEFWRYPAVAAAANRDVGLLPFGKIGQNLLLHGRKARLAIHEAQVAGFQAGEGFLGGAYGFDSVVGTHDTQPSVIGLRNKTPWMPCPPAACKVIASRSDACQERARRIETRV
ncbi:MAG: hypothetical protein IPK39_13135 [Sulfuritalea sp.]|nr:hypothetical protein [Sulfuritalea sp.]